MARHVLVVLPPDGGPAVVPLGGEPDGHADLEVAAGAALSPAGPELVGDDVVVHRCRGVLTPVAGPVPAELVGLVAQAVGEETGRLPAPALRAPWYREGWAAGATTWADEVLAGTGRERTGPARVVSSWGLSQLLRLPTQRGPVWLKGCPQHFPAEPGTTRWLSTAHPGSVPDVLGADPARGLLLMSPMPSEPATGADLGAVGARIADLQLASRPHRLELAALGVPDRGLAATATRFAEVVERALGGGLVVGDAARRLAAAVPRVVDRCADLAGAGLPDTLCHGDLHLGNVVLGADGPVLFDWSDACWSHPFLDVVHLPRSGRGRDAATGWERGYLDRWREAGWSAPVLAAALGAAALVERAFQAVTYEDLGRALEAASGAVLAGVLPRILGEVAELAHDPGGAVVS